jgi:hypothetical protein
VKKLFMSVFVFFILVMLSEYSIEIFFSLVGVLIMFTLKDTKLSHKLSAKYLEATGIGIIEDMNSEETKECTTQTLLNSSLRLNNAVLYGFINRESEVINLFQNIVLDLVTIVEIMLVIDPDGKETRKVLVLSLDVLPGLMNNYIYTSEVAQKENEEELSTLLKKTQIYVRRTLVDFAEKEQDIYVNNPE